jgi:Flp pilus assembly pilin Flp
MGKLLAILSAKWAFLVHENGQTIVEYALIVALFSVAMIAALGLYEGGLADYMQNIIDNLAAAY